MAARMLLLRTKIHCARAALLAGAALACSAQPDSPWRLEAPVTLKVAAVQLRSTFEVAANRDRILSFLERLAGQGVRVAVFPECALTGYDKDRIRAPDIELVPAAEEAIRLACRRLRIGAVIGSIYRINGRTYNTAVVFDSHGNLVERYAKLMLAGEKWATPGNHIALFELEGVPSTVIICHDERYPEFVRLPALAGARIVYYISHESGLREEHKLAPYRAQLMARAVENQVFIVAANAPANFDLTGSHGQSRIINEDGNVVREAGFFGEDVLIEELGIKPRRLDRPLQGLMGAWWKQGLELMLGWRGRGLE
jgi:omega-amidase